LNSGRRSTDDQCLAGHLPDTRAFKSHRPQGEPTVPTDDAVSAERPHHGVPSPLPVVVAEAVSWMCERNRALKEEAIMLKRNLIAVGYAILLPVSSAVLVVLVAAGVEGAVSGARRLAGR
jgi:hypothetical protein